MPDFTIQSHLAVNQKTFWDAFGMDAVNQELSPLVAMTAPPAWAKTRITQWQTGRFLFRSWILLFGFLPIDRHSFRLVEIHPGAGFKESSSSWMNREWNHERWTTPVDGGCIVTDHVAVVGRVTALTALSMPMFRLVFRHRHRRLRRRYPASPSRTLRRP